MKPLTFLPKETLLIAAFKNDETTDNIFKDFEVFEAILGRGVQQHLVTLKQRFLRDETLHPYLDGIDVYVSFHESSGQVDMLYTIPTLEHISSDNVDTYMHSLSPSYTVSEIDTLGEKIYGLQEQDSDSTLFVSYVSNTFFASYDNDILIKVLDKTQPKLSTEKIDYFIDNTNRNAPLAVYFVHENTERIADQFLRKAPGDFVKQFLHSSGHSAWNINYKQDVLILTGESEIADDDSSYIALFANQHKTRQRLYQYLPANTGMYIEYTLSDTASFRSDLKRLLEQRNEYGQLLDQAGSNRSLANYLGKEFAIAELSNRSYVGFISLADSSQFLRSIGRYAEQAGGDTYRLRNTNLLYALFGDAMKPFQRPYIKLYNDILVIANHPSTLNSVTQSIDRNDLLVGTIGFKNFERIQGNEANVTFFLQTRNASNTLVDLLPQTYARNFRNQEEYGFQDFYSWSAQLSGNSGNFISSLYGIYKTSTTLGATPEWTYQLNHRLITRPYLFQHSDTSQFILLQEQDHTVHGIHPNGTRLWSTVFSGRVVGDIIQLSDRSIVLVTDRNRLYRFDPEGQSYRGFSTGTAHEPTGTPSVFDIDGTPTILVQTRNQLLAYTMEGAPSENWQSTTIDGQLLKGVYQDGEHIVIGSSLGKIYFLAQDGSVSRSISTNQSGTTFKGQLGQLRSGESLSYVVMDTQANLHRFDANSHTSSTNIALNQELRGIHFGQLNDTDHPELLLIQSSKLNVLEVMNQVREVYHHNFTREINDAPLFFRNAQNQPLLGIGSRSTGLIYTFSETGSVVDGFPVEALPLFYYGKINYNTGDFLLLSRRDHKLYAYKH